MAACVVAAPNAAVPVRGTVSGQALDAGGRPLAYVRVELVEAVGAQPVGGVLQAVATDAQGAWAFGRVPDGDYVVRIATSGQAAGVAVSVTAGAVGPVRIIAPSIVTPAMQQGPATAGILSTLGGGSPAVGAAVVAGIAAGGALATMAATRTGPFKDDQS